MSIFGKIGGALKGAAKVATTPQRLAIKGVGSLFGRGGGGGSPSPIPGVGLAALHGSGGGFGGLGGIQAIQPPPNPNVPPAPDMATGGSPVGAAPMGGFGAMIQRAAQQPMGGAMMPQPGGGLNGIAGMLGTRTNPNNDAITALLRSQYPGLGG